MAPKDGLIRKIILIRPIGEVGSRFLLGKAFYTYKGKFTLASYPPQPSGTMI